MLLHWTWRSPTVLPILEIRADRQSRAGKCRDRGLGKRRPHTGTHRAHVYKTHTLTSSNGQYREKEIDRERERERVAIALVYTYTDAAFLHLSSYLHSVLFSFSFSLFLLFFFQVAFAVILFLSVSFRPIVSTGYTLVGPLLSKDQTPSLSIRWSDLEEHSRARSIYAITLCTFPASRGKTVISIEIFFRIDDIQDKDYNSWTILFSKER